MSPYKATESKREEFRRYLERAGVMEALTQVLVRLYEEQNQPENALEYIKEHLAGQNEELERAKMRINELEAELANLKVDSPPASE